MDIADALAEYREENNVALAWVADQIGLSRAHVHHIEIRKRVASLQTFRDLVMLMELNPEQIGNLVLAQENIPGSGAAIRPTSWDTNPRLPPKTRRKKGRSNG